MPLSDTAIRQAKTAPRPIKLFDERGDIQESALDLRDL